MGHIDHGKTSLLLSVRKMNVPEGKPGGTITQHVGAFEVERNGKKITFIDTPGHEAFSQIRSRGAKVADIALLVIAADEGIRQQTKEAIKHIKDANIPFIVVINKIDKPNANPEKVKGELLKEGIEVESRGGKVPFVETSAKTGKGIEDLLDLILLLAEMENLTTSIKENATGFVLESYLDSKRGPCATLILEKGILKKGDIIGTKSTLGKIKILEDFQGKTLEEALPSQPTTVIGFENVPISGEIFQKFENIEKARENIQKEIKKIEEIKTIKENQTNKKILNIIIKADVIGSLEAIEQIINGISTKEVSPRIIKKEIGDINQVDVKLASSAKAVIFGFRTKINQAAKSALKQEKVKIEQFEVIYDLVEKLIKYLNKITEPKIVRENLGKMKVLVVFKTEKNRQIVGGKITEGQIKKGAFIEIIKNDEVAGKGKIINLQKNKKDIQEAKKGEEVGILYEGNQKINVGDTLLIYTEEKKKDFET